MRRMVLAIALLAGGAVMAQEAPKKKKKPAGKQTELKAHNKPTPEQIRRFNELEKKK